MTKTKLIVLGQNSSGAKTKIKFNKYLLDDGTTQCRNLDDPEDCGYIELICRGYSDGVDLMFAYDNPDDRGAGILYLGQWNDGVV